MSSLAVPPFMSLAIESISGWRGFPNAVDLMSIPTTIVVWGECFVSIQIYTLNKLYCILCTAEQGLCNQRSHTIM